jgi:hypothetical protein
VPELAKSERSPMGFEGFDGTGEEDGDPETRMDLPF